MNLISVEYHALKVKEAIEYCADILYNGEKDNIPPVNKATFITLAKLSCCNVVMSTHKGAYCQIDGLAMGSPPAPHLANGWLSKYDPIIKADACMYERYMDDILQNISKSRIEEKLSGICIHP